MSTQTRPAALNAWDSRAVKGAKYLAVLREFPSDMVVDSLMEDVMHYQRLSIESAIATARSTNCTPEDVQRARDYLDHLVVNLHESLVGLGLSEEQVGFKIEQGQLHGPR